MYAIIFTILIIAWVVGFTWGGAAMCSKNNAADLILCFLGTSLLGLLIGCVCLSNARETKRNKNEQVNQEIWRVQDIKREETNKEDKEVIKDLLKQNQELLAALKKKDNNNKQPTSLIADTKNENQENRKIR